MVMMLGAREGGMDVRTLTSTLFFW
jgi:hypothetical protein